MADPSIEPSLKRVDSTFPAVHVLHLCDVLGRWSVPAPALLEPLGLTEEELVEPGARIDLGTLQRATERARELSGEPGIGFHLGMQMRISLHGQLGFAAMTAANVREAIDVAVRFAPTRTRALGLRLHEHGGTAALVVDERVPLGSAQDAVVFSLMVGIWQIGNALTGEELDGSADVAFPEPGYYARYASFGPGLVRFDQPAHQLLFDASILDLPLRAADPAAQRLALAQCERDLDALGHRDELLERVRNLASADEGFHTLAEVARRMHVSPRTLKRKLAARGTSFSTLVDTMRRERATLLVRAGDLSMDEIARSLGYADAGNFTRAFKRWTGKTPSAFRRRR